MDSVDALELVVGSTLDGFMDLLNEQDIPVDLTGVDLASFTVRKPGVVAPVLSRSIAGSTLSVVGSSLKFTLTQPEADALVAAEGLIGEVAFRIGGKWVHSDPFAVRVAASQAPHA